MPELSVVIPVYGCAGALRELHRRLRASIEALTADFELIFVEDAGDDGAWDVLVELAEEDPTVRAYGLSRNFGQDAAITAGLSRSAGRWVIVMDCDLQEPPEAIGELYAKAMEGYDVVRTTRQARGHSRLRRWSSRAYRQLMLERDSHPEYSNMSLLSRKVVEGFLSLRDRDREYTLVLDWLGFSQAVVTIDFVERETKSSYSLRRLIDVAVNGMFFRTTVLLRVVVFTGFLVALIGGGLAAYNVVYYFAVGQPTGYTSLLVVILLLSGLIIISVGVVGLYVGRIFEQVKYRPLFIIARDTGLREGSTPSAAASIPVDRTPPGRS